MKKLLYILPLFAAVALTSCGDDDENTAPSGAPAGGMTAKIDGTQWTAVADNIVTISSGSTNSIQGSQISGTTGKTIKISVDSAAVGTFTLADGFSATYTTANGQTPMMYSTDDSTATGTLTITKWDETNGLASGTFSFKAIGSSFTNTTGSVNVTDGSFNNVEF